LSFAICDGADAFVSQATTIQCSSFVQADSQEDHLGEQLPIWSIIPFIGILLSLAIFPLVAPKFWRYHYPKVLLFWASVFAVPFLLIFGSQALYQIFHIYIIDYIPFIILLWGLFTVSGGILLRGTYVGSPKVNLAFLVLGTILASLMGTTGASILLIRPLVRANRIRKYKVHTIIFFIFLVSNIGGSLTPLGDPPLFLGFLHGVPFFWPLNILPHMIVATLLLLVTYFIIDSLSYRKESHKSAKVSPDGSLIVEGWHNFVFLAGIIGAVLISGIWLPGEMNILGIHVGIQDVARDIFILTMGMFSLWTTDRMIRKKNGFTWFPIIEVAYLFAGIFMTIVPALAILKAGSKGSLAFLMDAISEPKHYFWASGCLSSFLDNAPTYLAFFNLALGRMGISESGVTCILTEMVHDNAGLFASHLKAISAGAVFYGAMSYIGNAPNFMVRSISEEAGVKMPTFFGYMLWSIGILIPIFIIITYLFF